ncbi:PadR family transcriptional regulator [Dethiobacter alkaliphilus]|uniref:Transcriptional regulator, PadR-like family n=1 Tax=Dethiobacter alkaliphilus AHT 1 TaxID=555088 RepID=C0GD85_DETAL|nr:PadR family transcriptional regulator [Dethiobacter alkaliphilus]EEG78606.1 transcriptional regulator, PadR-like family [Dethiobacter alkaliphilus AHT 1]
MADRSQFLRGTLEGCLLKIIETDETYGYEIATKLKSYGFQDISEGTIYPLLLRLEKNGFIESIKRASPQGPQRKYYYLTEAGETELSDFYGLWSEIRNSIDRLFREEGSDNV